MSNGIARASLRQPGRLFVLLATLLCTPAFAQSDEAASDSETIEEIVVVVNPRGERVDLNWLRLEEIRKQVIRDFAVEQTKQEQEYWRMKLRSSLDSKSSRISWGYDAQRDAAKDRNLQASQLPIDRVKPATLISVSF